MSDGLHALGWAKNITRAPDGTKITATEKLVLWSLANHYNPGYGYAFPRQSTLAEVCCLSRSSVSRALASLVKHGLIEQEHRFKDGQQINSRYRFNFAYLQTPTTVKPEPVEDEVEDVEPVKATATALRDGLLGIAPDLMADYADVGAHAGYRAVLDAAEILAADHPTVSKDTRKYLADATVTWAVEHLHGIPAAKVAGRIGKATATLGKDAHRALLAALVDTAATDFTGDPLTYIVRTAERRIAERREATS
jgi:DNA-binding transcriptional ArsR family regulator